MIPISELKSQPDNANKTTIESIKSILLKQEADWNKGDIDTYMEGYWNSDSLIFIGKSGIKYGWKSELVNYKKSYPDKTTMGKLKFGFIKFEILTQNDAIVIGTWDLTREKDNPHGYFTLILKKINKKWKIVADHSS